MADLKQAIAEKSDVPADRQRLIYSGLHPPPALSWEVGGFVSLTNVFYDTPPAGRVLKDEDVLSTYKIQSSHTIHMVKGAVRSGPSAQPSAPQQLPAMQAGQNPHDPLTQLNGPMGFGLMAGFNPFADMGLNPNDPNMVSPPHFPSRTSISLPPHPVKRKRTT